MKKSSVFVSLFIVAFINSVAQAVHYDDYEIQTMLDHTATVQKSTSYHQAYFSSNDPDQVIDKLLHADLTPLTREFILFNLLDAISQQPPQKSFQGLVNTMKTYQVTATRTHAESAQPQAIFNLRSKAYGIENIWTAYRSEQRFNQLFEQGSQAVITAIEQLNNTNMSAYRPQWLGIKNSIIAQPESKIEDLKQALLMKNNSNQLDSLISQVGLITGNTELINKALASKATSVRELTLRKLSTHLNALESQKILLASAADGPDSSFSTALLHQFNGSDEVEDFLIQQLNNKSTAANAAFALSKFNNPQTLAKLKTQFFSVDDKDTKNHILLTLKLNPSADAKLALDDLTQRVQNNSATHKWLKSFDNSKVRSQR